MNVTEQRFLRGPNLYAAAPCLLAVLEPAPAAPGLGTRILALLPGMAPQAAARLSDCPYAHDALEPVVMELQRLAGAPGPSSRTVVDAASVHVACGHVIEQVAALALRSACDLIDACARAEDFDLAPALDELRVVAQRHAIGTSTAAVLDAAHRRGIPSLRLTDDANLFQLGWGSRQKRLQATITGNTNHVAVGIASDKQLTKTLLDQAGVPVPAGSTVTTLDAALRAARRLKGPVAIKPLDANQGKGVTVNCTTPDEVERAFAFARTHGRHVIVEEFLRGRDYRVLVTGRKIAAAAWRRPPHVTGDGVATVRALVERENANPARGDGHANTLTRIPLDAIALQLLASQGLDLDAVPDAGREVALRGSANLSTGGTAEDVTDLLPEATRELCIRTARTIGLDVAGIDIVCADIARPLDEQDGGIIEVNAAPGIRMHQYPSRGTPRDAGGAIVEALFGAGAGRIPVVAVAGGAGATTTSRMIAHAARLAGRRSGVATTESIEIDGARIATGDGTGFHAARSVLAAPDVDFAVLQTGYAGIVASGLAFDRCDVAVLLDAAPGQAADAAFVVAASARHAVVLNAEDDGCVALADRMAGAADILYVALDADNPVLLRHLERGGRAVYLADNVLVLADGRRHEALLDARALPSTRADIASALAAAAALSASGFGHAEIAAGLRSFVPDRQRAPALHGVPASAGPVHDSAA